MNESSETNFTKTWNSTGYLVLDVSENPFNVSVNESNSTSLNPCDLYEYCEPLEDILDGLYADLYPDAGKWCLIVVYIITFLVGLVGNILVCFAIWRNPNMRTVTNIYIVNLSVADLAVILICLPSTLVTDVTLTWFFGGVLCKINIFLTVSPFVLSNVKSGFQIYLFENTRDICEEKRNRYLLIHYMYMYIKEYFLFILASYKRESFCTIR